MKNETELAYSEVDAILELLEDEFVNRIPEKVRKFFKDEKNKEPLRRTGRARLQLFCLLPQQSIWLENGILRRWRRYRLLLEAPH